MQHRGVPCPSPGKSYLSPGGYQKLPQTREIYLAYVVAIRDPLNYHLDIYWPPEVEARYESALHYDYTFISEELGEGIKTRMAYSCHLRGVEIASNAQNSTFENMKEAYIFMSRQIYRTGGWVLVSVSDIDIYHRVLVNIFDILTRQSMNIGLIQNISKRTGEHIAKEYVRPSRNKQMFQPSSPPKDYHIIFNG